MDSAAVPSESRYNTEHGSGPPLLLVHGLMVTREMFEPVLQPFATGHRVIVPDLRGHGGSRGLPAPYTAAQLAADLAHLLDRLEIRTCAILGYSHGGAIAQQLVLNHPGLCERLVLCCTFAFNMATPREWLEGHLTPMLVHVLGTRRMARLVVSQAASQLGPERAAWLVRLMADQERGLMVPARGRRWRSTAEIAWPRSGARRSSSPDHRIGRCRSTMRRCCTTASPVLRWCFAEGADHTLIWTHSNEFVGITKEFVQT